MYDGAMRVGRWGDGRWTRMKTTTIMTVRRIILMMMMLIEIIRHANDQQTAIHVGSETTPNACGSKSVSEAFAFKVLRA